MSMRKRRAVSGERGQVIVIMALLLPVFFGFGAVVIDIGNWYVHKRHLQTQVDAAALASGPQFVGCFHNPTVANQAIASRALAYGGDTLRPGQYGPNAPDSTTNLQLQEPDDVRIALNSSRYWQQSDGNVPGTNGYGLDNTAAIPGDPCSTRFLDVKATDDEAPLLWGLLPVSTSPKSKARVEIRDAESLVGMLPWAVPEIDPKAVVALFVNEDNGSVYKVQDLIQNSAYDPNNDADNNPSTNPFPWSAWVTPVGQEEVFVTDGRANTGIVILVSKNDPTPTTSGTLASICGQDPGLVACYSGSGSSSGLTFIHGYNGGGTGTLRTPIIRQVNLFAVGCTAADLSAPYFTLDGGCTANIEAVVDFGVTSGDPTQWPNCAKVRSSPGGDLSWAGNVTEGSRFTGTISLPAGSGRIAVNINWDSEDRPGGPNNCNQTRWSGSFSKVAAPYVADNASGPVQYLDLTAFKSDGTTLMPDPNSVELNDAGNPHYKYYVAVGLPKPHSIGNYSDPPLVLRMGSPSGSQNQAWDCDSGRNFREEVETGCMTRYIENYRDLDGDGDKEWNNILCNGYGTGNLPPSSFDPNPRPDCVITETGDKTGQLRDGLHDRFETPCYYNNWPDNQTEADVFFGPDGGGYGNDPRYVTLIITDDTAFTGSGNEPLPVKYFAGFYVTGWDYHPTQSPGCPDPDGPSGPLKGNDCHPIYGCSYQHAIDNGDVWGYFVDIVVFSGGGDPSDELCQFGAEPAACIAVLVE